jgi:hypothetical protein
MPCSEGLQVLGAPISVIFLLYYNKEMTKQNAKDVKDAADLIYGSEAAEKLLKQKYKDSGSEFFDPVPDVIGYKQHAGECFEHPKAS